MKNRRESGWLVLDNRVDNPRHSLGKSGTNRSSLIFWRMSDSPGLDTIGDRIADCPTWQRNHDRSDAPSLQDCDIQHEERSERIPEVACMNYRFQDLTELFHAEHLRFSQYQRAHIIVGHVKRDHG